MGIADSILGTEPAPTSGPRRTYTNNGPDPFVAVNDLDPKMVGDRLGIERDGDRIKHCPHCGADAGVDYLDHGWKCLHASCAAMAKNGFRTNVDTIVELRNCTPLEAARWAAAEFRTPEPGADRPREPQRQPVKSDDTPADFYDRLAATTPEATAEFSKLMAVATGKRPAKQTKTDIKSAMSAAFTAVKDRVERGGKLAGVASGYTKLDYALDGWQRKKMYVIGARAGMGKSVASLNLALRFAEAGQRVLYFTLEMTNEEQVVRALFNRAEVGLHRMKKNTLFDSHWSRLGEAAGTLAKLPIHFDEACGLTNVEIERRIVEHKREHGELFCVVVDHTLLVHGANERQPRRDQLNGIIERFKNIAKEHDVCVIALAQLNRALEARAVKDKRPQMSDLKETGAFEEFADAVMLLYREDYYHFGEGEYKRDNVIEFIVPKVRGGKATRAELEFIGSQCRINQPEGATETTESEDE